MTMAYSSVRVQFEIGHEASVRTKKTPEGFTHDWEVFVRGADNTDIQWFVDKVVFHLHETFPKPRRVIKEPPYVVKESGYAGFVLPIDVYLKNKEEPKKINFQYDLTLQSSGPPISRVLREPRLFQNPSEDFRRKLIRGGGVGVDTPSEPPADDLKSGQSMQQNKSKPADSPAKKHKSEQPLNHSFAELFGTPIRRVPEPKKLPEPPKKLDDKKKSSKPYKEEKEASKEKYSERERSKEKAKRPPSPSPSPSLPPPPAPQVKSKDEHKKHEEKEKKKEEEKKKRKEEKDKKEKTKDPERQLEKEHKKDKKESREGDYAKKLNSKPPDARPNYEKPNSEGLDKEKERLEKEKHKHRHKKKEKEKNRDKEKYRKEKEKETREREKEKGSKKKHEEGREKEEKRRKSRSPSPVHVKKGPLNALLDELGSSDSASPLSEDESIPPVKPLPKPPAKTVPEIKPQPPSSKPKSTNSTDPTPKPEEGTLNKNKKEKSSSKKSKKSDKDSEKKKEKDEPRARSLSNERAEREEDEEKERPVKDERTEKDRAEEEKPKARDKENRKRRREKSEEKQTKSKKNEGPQSGAAEGSDGAAEELRRPQDKFTKEYVAQLRDLQHRIMTLEDNAELQKVVKVIAETGQYEVTKKTFDFDLCALDMETVKRLQEFFAPT